MRLRLGWPDDQSPAEPRGWLGAPSDAELVERVRSGDVDAYELLVLRYQARVYSHVCRMLGNGDEAADVTQEVFVKVYTTLNQFRGQASFQTWLYRVTANLCVDRHRRRLRSPQIGRSLDAPVETDSGEVEAEYPDTDPEGSPEDSVLSKELQVRVREAMDQLSEKLKSVMVMHDLDGLSYEEIADVLSIPLGTVKSRLFHARAALKELLEPYVRLRTTDSRREGG